MPIKPRFCGKNAQKGQIVEFSGFSEKPENLQKY